MTDDTLTISLLSAGALMPHVRLEEVRIALTIVQDALAQGWSVSVNDGGETTLHDSRDIRAILKAMGTTGQDYLMFSKSADGATISGGWVWLIWGNGSAVVTDYSAITPTEEILAGAEQLEQQLRD